MGPVPQPVLWMSLCLLGAQWDVWITTKEHHPDLDEWEGWTDGTKATIYISAHIADSRKPEVLIHEIIHAVDMACGLESTFTKISPAVEWKDREEALVSSQSPLLYDVLNRSGLLRIPAIPKEAELLKGKK